MLDSETNCAGQPARGGKMICAAVDCVNLIDAHQPLFFFLGSDLFVIKWAGECMYAAALLQGWRFSAVRDAVLQTSVTASGYLSSCHLRQCSV